MNKFNKISLVLALMGGLFFTQSCVQDDDYSIPPMDCTGLTTTMQLSDLIDSVNLSTGNNNLVYFTENAVVEAYVISSDETGNFFKTISIQDHPTNPTTNGIQIEIDANSLYTQYPLGSKIQVQLNGLVAGYDRGVIKLGSTYVQNGETRVGRMPSALATSNVKKTCESVEPLAPKVVNTIAEALKPENINTLVTIKNVQFANPTEDVTYGDAVGLTTVNRQLVDRKGKYVDLRNSGYATFARENLPTKSGEITVVVSIYNSGYQLYIRDLNDVKFDQDRFEPGQAELPTSAAKYPFLGADFNNWADFLASANSFAYDPIVKEAQGQGIDGSGALLLEGQRSQNGFAFTTRTTGTNLPANPTKLHFWVKGTAAKSLNIYVYKTDGSNYSFNVGSLTENKLVTENNGGNNSYTGTINTNGEWKVVQLDLEGLTDINTTNAAGNFIAFRVGNNANYNLLIDNITIE